MTGKLASNACVAPGGAPDPWEFDVKLSRDGSTLYWIQGGLPVQGTLDASHHTTMSSTASNQVTAPDPKNNVSGCSMQRDDALDVTLTADPPTGFAGTLGYTFSATDGSDCSGQLAVAGGGWTNLPCQLSYTLAAVKTDKTTLTY